MLLALSLSAALAGQFNVSPTSITLARDKATTLLTIRNDGARELRLQVSTYSWDQRPTEDMVLEPSDDIVVFPSILSVAPGESRKLRIGTTARFEMREEAYRVFVQELPSIDADGAVGVQVLTRVGIPVFLAPKVPEVVAGGVHDVSLSGGELCFSADNEGNRHVMLRHVEVSGTRADGTRMEQRVRGWYLLPGRRRTMSMALDPRDCASVDLLTIRAETDRGLWTGSFVPTAAACAR